jgi:uncharacterized protein YkwD
MGTDVPRACSYGAQVPTASAALPVRFALAASLLAALAAFVVTAPADGGARKSGVYLAPASVCANATNPAAAPVAQRRAVTCLINWARRQDRRAKLAPSSSLRTAAALKGEKVAACKQLSHTPCGTNLDGPVKAAGYRYASFGENLYVGPTSVTAQHVVTAWLNSPSHRATILAPHYRDLGVTFVRAQGILNAGPEVVWIATFGSRR